MIIPSKVGLGSCHLNSDFKDEKVSKSVNEGSVHQWLEHLAPTDREHSLTLQEKGITVRLISCLTGLD